MNIKYLFDSDIYLNYTKLIEKMYDNTFSKLKSFDKYTPFLFLNFIKIFF